MLDYYFELPRCLDRMRLGPLSDYIDGLAEELHSKGYSRRHSRDVLRITGKFNNFANKIGINNVRAIDESLVDRFINAGLLPKSELIKLGFIGTRHILNHLRQNKIIDNPNTPSSEEPFADLINGYEANLRDVRGLAPATRKGYLRESRRLLKWFHQQHEGYDVGKLCGKDILEFITEAIEKVKDPLTNQQLCCLTKIFLRYLFQEGIIDSPLDHVVPKYPVWRLTSVPRHIPWDRVRKLIDNIDTTLARGKRDKAILLLIATLGFRNSDIVRLHFEHILWRLGEIRLPRTKNRKERILPLYHEVGEALTDYIINGRPASECLNIFLRHIAPIGSFDNDAVGTLIRWQLQQTGVDAPSQGGNMLRHSLATHMVNSGMPIGEIANIFGHSCIDTTAVYTKVDITGLSQVAAPFIEGGTI